ncbi:MAG: LPS-assembly protein LptD [Bacteroidetes bacterium]|nr:LPS-assembly protein LptD [Bacteroidota bacterium]
MQLKRPIQLFILFALLISQSMAFAAFTSDSTTVSKPAEISDSTKTVAAAQDSVKISKSALKSKVVYSARDSIRLEVELQKVYLYGDAHVTYEDTKLDAEQIILDTKNNFVTAHGIVDSTGKRIGDPKFTDGGQEFSSKGMSYNFETKKGKINEVITKEGEGILHGEQVKRDSSNNFFVRHGKYTTCDLEHPHFYISASKVRVIPNDKIITGPAYLVIADVPTPLMLPFGFFPNKKGQKSGILIPTYGESQSQGFFLTDGGYYFGISDKMNLSVRGDIYSKGTWGAKAQSNYAKRYKYNGAVTLSYANQKFGEKYLDTYTSLQNFRVNWTHSQDPRARPDRRFSASVNAGSSGFGRYQNTTSRQYLQNELNSSINFSKNWIGKPYTFSTSINHNQNTLTKSISIKLPDLNFSVARILPFQNIEAKPGTKWLKTLGFSYNTNLSNQLDTYDSLFFKKGVDMTARMKNGMHHSIPISTSIKLFKYFNVNPTFNYNENWYLQTIRKSYSYTDAGVGVLKIDTVNKFSATRDYAFSTNLTTTVYGMYQFKRGKLKAMRHVLTPTVGYGYVPGLGKRIYGPWGTNGSKSSYTIYDETIFKGPNTNESSAINFGLSNNLELKVKSSKDTVSGFKKIGIFDNLSAYSSYNMIADSMKLAPFNLNMRTRLLQNVDLIVNSTLDPYRLDSMGVRRKEYVWTEKNSLGRITNSNASISFSLKSKDKVATKSEPENTNNPGKIPGTVDDDYVDFSVPWSLNVSYNLAYFKPALEKTITQTLSFYGDVSITENWKVSINSGFDFNTKKLSYTSVNIHRDLHCWEMHLNLVPLGPRRSYSFELRVKSSVLSDLKIPRKQDWYDLR